MTIRSSRIPAANVSQVPQLSPLRYPGGKTWLVPHIRKWLTHHPRPVLVEPFAGGAIASLTAVAEKLVDRAVLMERDGNVCVFWLTVLNDGKRLAAKVRGFDPTPENIAAAEQDGTDPAFCTLVRNRTRRGGILASGASRMRRGEGGRGVASRWYGATLARRIEAVHAMANRLEIRWENSMRALPALLAQSAHDPALFVDAPYWTTGGRLYDHHVVDHARIFEILADTGVSFLMTYGPEQEVVDLVERYDFHAVRVTMRGTHNKERSELVITREKLF